MKHEMILSNLEKKKQNKTVSFGLIFYDLYIFYKFRLQ